LKPYRFWLIGVWFLLKGIWLWLDVVLVFLPPLCLPQNVGEVILEAGGFWLGVEIKTDIVV
jgi:hypothetical protein